MPEIIFMPIGFDIPKQMKECADCAVQFDALSSLKGANATLCSDCTIKAE